MLGRYSHAQAARSRRKVGSQAYGNRGVCGKCVGMNLLLLSLLAKFSVSVAAPSPSSTASDGNVAPKYFSPNPPGCATTVTRILSRLTILASAITRETTVCAYRFGFHEGLDDVQSGYVFDHDERNWPLDHSERSCAIKIVGTIGQVSGLVADVEALLFVCFNINQGCGQTIAKAFKLITRAANIGVRTSVYCEVPGKDQPYWPNHDIPLKGFLCWKIVWKQLQLLLTAAKFVDVAVMMCPTSPQEPPQPSPAPLLEPLPVQALPGGSTSIHPQSSEQEPVLGQEPSWPSDQGHLWNGIPGEASAESSDTAAERRLRAVPARKLGNDFGRSLAILLRLRSMAAATSLASSYETGDP